MEDQKVLTQFEQLWIIKSLPADSLRMVLYLILFGCTISEALNLSYALSAE